MKFQYLNVFKLKGVLSRDWVGVGLAATYPASYLFPSSYPSRPMKSSSLIRLRAGAKVPSTVVRDFNVTAIGCIRSAAALVAFAAMVSPPQVVSAANVTWSNVGTTDFNTGTNWTGGSGTGQDPIGAGDDGMPTSADFAVFGTATPSFQPDISAGSTLLGISFTTLSGGWTLGSANNSVLTLTSVGTGATSAINAANTSGTNTVSSVLVLGGAGATTATLTQAAGGTLALTGDISSTNAITGLSLVAGGAAGTFTLSGNNTYSGTTSLTSTNVKLNINSATAISSGALVFGASGTIDNTSGTASLVLTNNNNINLSGGNLTYTGTGGNSLSFGSGVLTVSGGNRTATVNGGTLTIGSIDADAVGRTFTKAGAGTLTITGAAGSNFQGGYLTTAGTTIIGNKAALGSGNISIGTATLQASADLSGANKISNTVSLTGTGAPGATFSGLNNIEIGGKLSGGAGSRTITNSISGGALTLTDVDIGSDATARTLTIAGAGNTTISGVIANGIGSSAANILAITSTGVTTLNGDNTYTGSTTLSSGTGTIQVGHNNAFGTGALNFNTAVLAASGGARTLANAVNFVNANNYAIGGSQDLTLSGAMTWFGSQTLTVDNTGTTTFAGALSLRDTGTATRSFTLAGAGNTKFTGVISNGTSYNATTTFNGSGVAELNASNTYTGTTSIGSGKTVRLGNANGLGRWNVGATTATGGGTTVSSGGALDLNGQTGIVENITLNGTGVGGNGALINSNIGTEAVLDVGLTGIATTTGGTGYTSAPTVTISGGGGTGATADAVISGGVIVGYTLTNAGSGYGSTSTAMSVSLSGGGFTTAGTATASVSSVALGSATTIGGAGNILINSRITGTNTLTKDGTGRLTLAGANSYTGATTLSNGSLFVNGSITSAVTANAGIFGGTGSSTQTVAINTGATFTGGGYGSVGTFTTTNVTGTTLASGSTFYVDFNSTLGTFDKLVTSGLSLTNANLVLNNIGASDGLTLNQTFVIVDKTGAGSVGGTFLNLAEGGTVNSGIYTFSISYVGGTGNDIALTVLSISSVPEPATYAAIAGAVLLGFTVVRRRRRIV